MLDPRTIDWSTYSTAYGSAEPVLAILLALAEKDHKRALCAAAELEAYLCHQHVQLASASLPALPFILQALADCSEDIAEEILFVLWGFAQGTESHFWRIERPKWVAELRRSLCNGQSSIAEYVDSSNEDCRCYAQETLRILRDQAPVTC